MSANSASTYDCDMTVLKNQYGFDNDYLWDDFLFKHDPDSYHFDCFTHYVKSAFPTIRRGDVLVSSSPFPSPYVFLWDGNKVVQMDYEYDECGLIPASFVITDTEFSPTWWSHAIAHNSIIWLSADLRKDAADSLCVAYNPHTQEGEEVVGRLVIAGKPYNISTLDPDDDEMPISIATAKALLLDMKHPLRLCGCRENTILVEECYDI